MKAAETLQQWIVPPRRATPISDRSTGHSGKKCAKINASEGADAAWSQNVNLPSPGRYRLSGWIKTENLVVQNGAGALLNIHGLEPARTKALTGTNDWTKVECEFDIAAENQLMVNCLFGGWGQAAGTAWFDDIALELLEAKKIESKTCTSTVQIDASQTEEPISKYIYGQFIEHLGDASMEASGGNLEDRFLPDPSPQETWRTTWEQRVLADSP